MAVNPVSGAVVFMLEAPVRGDPQAESQGRVYYETIIIAWPTGVLQEEPLKLSVSPDVHATDLMPSAIVSSASAGPQIVVSRVCSRKVFYWRFDSALCPTETIVAIQGGLIAISSSGRWLAVVEKDDFGNHHTKVWCYDNTPGGNTAQMPSLVSSLDRNPRTMAIAHLGDKVLLALSDDGAPGSAPPPVEVLSIQPDGTVACSYRLMPESPCKLLSFCFDNPNFLACTRDDGVVGLHNLPRGTAGMHRDDAMLRSVSISANRQLILSAHNNLFHVYKAVQPAA